MLTAGWLAQRQGPGLQNVGSEGPGVENSPTGVDTLFFAPRFDVKLFECCSNRSPQYIVILTLDNANLPYLVDLCSPLARQAKVPDDTDRRTSMRVGSRLVLTRR